MMGPRDHMAPGQPGIHEGPRPHMDVPQGQGPPMDHDGHFRPLDHPDLFLQWNIKALPGLWMVSILILHWIGEEQISPWTLKFPEGLAGHQ